MRITRKHIEAQAEIVNRLRGLEGAGYSTVGAVAVNGAYGGYAVHEYCNESGGVRDLTGGHYTMREVSWFLRGMIEALRAAQDVNR